jgi:hypothetical protein
MRKEKDQIMLIVAERSFATLKPASVTVFWSLHFGYPTKALIFYNFTNK